MNTHEYLTDIASRFVILPKQLADAMDEHDPHTTKAWVWIVDGKLLNLKIDN